MAINTKPTPEQIKKHPREFALYCQAIHGNGELNVQVRTTPRLMHNDFLSTQIWIGSGVPTWCVCVIAMHAMTDARLAR